MFCNWLWAVVRHYPVQMYLRDQWPHWLLQTNLSLCVLSVGPVDVLPTCLSTSWVPASLMLASVAVHDCPALKPDPRTLPISRSSRSSALDPLSARKSLLFWWTDIKCLQSSSCCNVCFTVTFEIKWLFLDFCYDWLLISGSLYL